MKSFFRFLKGNPLYLALNVVGLALSLMFVILIGDYTWRQFSADSFHKNKDRIVLLGVDGSFYSWPDASLAISQTYPQIESMCRTISTGATIRGEQTSIDGEEEISNVLIADPTFFDFFDFHILEGDRKAALSDASSCVLTRSYASRLFPDSDPLGQALRIVGNRAIVLSEQNDPYDSTFVYTVSAVVEDFDRTVFPPETGVVVSSSRASGILGFEQTTSIYVSGPGGPAHTFFMLKPGTSLDGEAESVGKYLYDHVPALNRSAAGGGETAVATFTPLDGIMFSPANVYQGFVQGDKSLLLILLSAGLAILLFAVTNYINLTVANTGFRAKEMAVRQLLGSDRGHVCLSLVGESTLMVAVSFVIGFLLALLFQNDAAALFKGKIDLLSDLSAGTVSVCLAFVVVLGALSGIIPGLQMARYKPIDVVKGTFRYRSKMVIGRLFIIVQNFITMVMLVSALTIYLQIRHIVNAPMGYETDGVMCVMLDDGASSRMYDELSALPCVEKLGVGGGTCIGGSGRALKRVRDIDGNYMLLDVTHLDNAAFGIYGFNLLSSNGAGVPGAYLLNRTAAERLGAGEGDTEFSIADGVSYPLAGVVADFHLLSVLNEAGPFMIGLYDELPPEYASYIVLKTDGSAAAEKAVRQTVFRVSGSEDPWNVQVFKEEIAGTLSDETNTLKVVGMFAAIAVIISIMGFIGMSLFFIRQRRKEIGVRKIMGGTSRQVLSRLLLVFCAPLLVSFVISVPVSWVLMSDWLKSFSYRIVLGPWIFVSVGLAVLAVALVSVFFQLERAARSNPADSLKME